MRLCPRAGTTIATLCTGSSPPLASWSYTSPTPCFILKLFQRRDGLVRGPLQEKNRFHATLIPSTGVLSRDMCHSKRELGLPVALFSRGMANVSLHSAPFHFPVVICQCIPSAFSLGKNRQGTFLSSLVPRKLLCGFVAIEKWYIHYHHLRKSFPLCHFPNKNNLL